MNLVLALKSFFLILLLTPRPLPHPGSPSDRTLPGESRFVVMVPSGETREGFPVLLPIPAGDSRNQVIRELRETTFIGEMVRFHEMLADSLFADSIVEGREPLYLLLSGRMGGYPMHGFWLQTDSGLLDKTMIPYVDLSTVEAHFNGLSSVTQIYPHELAHIYYRLLTGRDPEKEKSWSCDLHYFSIVTDQAKAFNEGYAESFENLARQMEPSEKVREGIRQDVSRMNRTLERYTRGFEKDYEWPLRIGYYRMTMVVWYQQLEDYKRFVWAMDGKAKYRPAIGRRRPEGAGPGSGIRDPGLRIAFRNACVTYDSTCTLNFAQAAACEGVINSFFTLLREGNTSVSWQNQLLKEFRVFRKYLRNLPDGSSPLQAFIGGYLAEYPAERKHLLEAWEKAAGAPYREDPVGEIWLLNQGYRHGFWVMDQFGGSNLPFYTINMNTASTEDLMTFPGMTHPEAERIMEWRDSAGYFRSVGEVVTIPGVSAPMAALIQDHLLVPETLEAMDNEGNIGLGSLLSGILKRLGWVTLLVATFVSAGLFGGFHFRKRPWKKTCWMIIRTLFKTLLFVLAGLITLIFPVPTVPFYLLFVVLVLGINLLRTRSNHEKRPEILASTMLLGMVVCYSLL